jgi:hypothetical protein
MKTLKIVLVILAVIFSGFARDSQVTQSGAAVPMKFDGVILTNPSAGLTECTPKGEPYPFIAHSRTGWLKGNQTHGGKLITELSTWEITSCNTDFGTMLNTSQINGVNTVANGDAYYFTCVMTVNIISNDVTLDIDITGGTGRYEGATGQMTLTGVHTETGIPVSGEGSVSFLK